LTFNWPRKNKTAIKGVRKLIKAKDIIDEIHTLVIAKFPSYQGYINVCPPAFQRPAYLIRCTKFEKTDKNRSTIGVTGIFSVTVFSAVDGNGISDAGELLEAQNTIADIFRSGYIAVGIRRIKVKSTAGTVDASSSIVDLQFEFFDDRTDKTDNNDPIGVVNTNIFIRRD
jgi:hypothetical protein